MFFSSSGGLILWNIARGYQDYSPDYAKFDSIVAGLVNDGRWVHHRFVVVLLASLNIVLHLQKRTQAGSGVGRPRLHRLWSCLPQRLPVVRHPNRRIRLCHEKVVMNEIHFLLFFDQSIFFSF